MKVLPTWRYRLCLRLVSPILLLHLCWRSTRDGGWHYFKQRLGFIREDKQRRIHIHAASVGEVITVLPLIEKIQSQQSAPAFLVTTNTPTGAAILSERLQRNAIHAYLPLDFSGATKRFFAQLNISSIWIVETEIWPWLYARAKQRGTPIAIVNARLGHKSNGALANFFDDTYATALQGVHVLARSTEDAKRYVQKGADEKNVSTIGNLKFAPTNQPPATQPLISAPYVLAASTHEDEEVLLAAAWLNASVNQLLVIAPRHAERGAKLAKSLSALQQEIAPLLPPLAQRSLGEQPTQNCKLYLADTLGEMNHWYAHATAAFVGGSLIQRGGHNVLEPARVGTPIIVGEHTFNFVEEVALLKSADGIAIARNADEAVQMLSRSALDSAWAQTMGTRAKLSTNAQSNVVDLYYASLSVFIFAT